MPTPTYIKTLKYRVFLPTISLLPKKMAYFLAARLGLWMYLYFEKEWVQSYRKGLQEFYGADEATTKTWTINHFRMMAREELDAYFLKNVKTLSDLDWVKFNPDYQADLDVFKHDSNGKIIIMTHLGRPILLSSFLGLSGSKIGMLSQAIDESNPHLDSPTRHYLNFKMKLTVSLAGGRWVTTNQSPSIMYRALKQGENIIIMMDLVEGDSNRQHSVAFGNGCLKLPPGIIRLANKSGASLYYADSHDMGRQTLCRLKCLSNHPSKAMAEAGNELLKTVNTSPWLWWQWNILHLIWKKS